jgi:hypothetical protein
MPWEQRQQGQQGQPSSPVELNMGFTSVYSRGVDLLELGKNLLEVLDESLSLTALLHEVLSSDKARAPVNLLGLVQNLPLLGTLFATSDAGLENKKNGANNERIPIACSSCGFSCQSHPCKDWHNTFPQQRPSFQKDTCWRGEITKQLFLHFACRYY